MKKKSKIYHLFTKSIILTLSLLITACSTTDINPVEQEVGARPSKQQLEYQQMELVGFIHFTVNTFTDREWGMGDEDPSVFNPTELDAEQWVLTAKAAGMKELILTAKHHDGFCLWPSEYTNHDISNSPYKDGQGDIVKEFTDACKKHSLKAGIYLSPWDRNHAEYGTEKYIEYYRNQLKELLGNYGEINEIWFDGANGGLGYYGGANEVRTIDRKSYYDWENTIALVKELQPDIKIFSDAGPDLRWVGNEHGHAGESFWSTIDPDVLVIGGSDSHYLNSGEPKGQAWIIGQCDVSIRPGWFYHESEDDRVKATEELMDIYYKSVGRNGVLLLNLPPDRRGLIHENDIASLKAFRKKIDEVFAQNLAAGKPVITEGTHKRKTPDPAILTDGSLEDYWWRGDTLMPVSFIVDLEEETEITHVVLQEAIEYGQRISSFRVECQEAEEWKTIAEGTTVGYKRILQIEPVSCTQVRVVIEEALAVPMISEVEVY